jgi:hypothetical protein
MSDMKDLINDFDDGLDKTKSMIKKIKSIGRVYNDIASYCALPVIPKFVVEDK